MPSETEKNLQTGYPQGKHSDKKVSSVDINSLNEPLSVSDNDQQFLQVLSKGGAAKALPKQSVVSEVEELKRQKGRRVSGVTTRGTARVNRFRGGPRPTLDTKVGARVPGKVKEDWDSESSHADLKSGESLEMALTLQTLFLRKAREAGHGTDEMMEEFNNLLEYMEKNI